MSYLGFIYKKLYCTTEKRGIGKWVSVVLSPVKSWTQCVEIEIGIEAIKLGVSFPILWYDQCCGI